MCSWQSDLLAVNILQKGESGASGIVGVCDVVIAVLGHCARRDDLLFWYIHLTRILELDDKLANLAGHLLTCPA